MPDPTPTPTPTYTLTLPSLTDDTPLDCRVYFNPAKVLLHQSPVKSRAHAHADVGNADGNDSTERPQRPVSVTKGAVLAHPYAPLGGSFDDPVVLSLCEVLAREGWLVATFNFRGAGGSAGGTSWSGKAEQGDFGTAVGFLVLYLRALISAVGGEEGETGYLERILSVENESTALVPESYYSGTEARQEQLQQQPHIELLLGGYSYGSLVLARLPPVSAIMERFSKAEKGSAASEIILRANTLAAESKRTIESARQSLSPSARGRQLRPQDRLGSPIRSPRTGASPITLGGEETDPSERRRSRDSRRSADLMRKSMEKAHIKRQSMTAQDSQQQQRSGEKETRASFSRRQQNASTPVLSVRYLLISPVLLPFTQSLCPPGPVSLGFSFGKNAASNSGSLLFLENLTLAVFGSKDVFTSSQRLTGWADKQARSSKSSFEWENVEGAGHFWREEGAMQALRKRVGDWAESDFDTPS